MQGSLQKINSVSVAGLTKKTNTQRQTQTTLHTDKSRNGLYLTVFAVLAIWAKMKLIKEHALTFHWRSRWPASFLSHILGLGPMTLKLSQPRVLSMHLSTKFHYPMFNHSKVIVLTKRFCWKHPSHSTMLCQWKIIASTAEIRILIKCHVFQNCFSWYVQKNTLQHFNANLHLHVPQHITVSLCIKSCAVAIKTFFILTANFSKRMSKFFWFGYCCWWWWHNRHPVCKNLDQLILKGSLLEQPKKEN